MVHRFVIITLHILTYSGSYLFLGIIIIITFVRQRPPGASIVGFHLMLPKSFFFQFPTAGAGVRISFKNGRINYLIKIQKVKNGNKKWIIARPYGRCQS